MRAFFSLNLPIYIHLSARGVCKSENRARNKTAPSPVGEGWDEVSLQPLILNRHPNNPLPPWGRGQNGDNFVLRLLHHEVRTNE